MIAKCSPLLLLTNLMQVIVSAAAALHVEPAYLHDLVELENKTVQITVSMTKELFEEVLGAGDLWRISARSLHPNVAGTQLTDDEGQADDDEAEISFTPPFNASSLNATECIQNADGEEEKNGTKMTSSPKTNATERCYSLQTALTVRGKLLGKTGVEIRLVRMDASPYAPRASHDIRTLLQSMKEAGGPENETKAVIDVWVKRDGGSERLTIIFVGAMMAFFFIANVLEGCKIDLDKVLETIQKPTAWWAWFIGMVAHFLLMPTLAYFIAKSVFVPYQEYSLALGLFVTGCAPGGGVSNFFTLLLDGNVYLSVTMTFLSTLASFFLMPMWLSLLGKEFLVGFSSGSVIKVPYAEMCSMIFVFEVLPLLLGALIARYKKEWATKAKAIERFFIIAALLIVAALGALSNLFLIKMITARALLAGLLLPLSGFLFGFGVAAILVRRPLKDLTTIAIETGIQNTGVAILLLKVSFPAPDSDISSLLPVIVACFSAVPPLAFAAVRYVMKKQSADVKKSSISTFSSLFWWFTLFALLLDALSLSEEKKKAAEQQQQQVASRAEA